MNSDRTESDWQGLVSEVRPRRRPGGMGRAELPPAPGPRPRWPSQGRDARGTRTRWPRRAVSARPARCTGPPALSGLSRCHFLPRHMVPAFGEGPFLRQGLVLDWREKPGDPGEGAKSHLPSWSPLFWSQAIGRPVLKRKGGARGEIRAQGNSQAKWNYPRRRFGWWRSGSPVAFIHSLIQLNEHVLLQAYCM